MFSVSIPHHYIDTYFYHLSALQYLHHIYTLNRQANICEINTKKYSCKYDSEKIFKSNARGIKSQQLS